MIGSLEQATTKDGEEVLIAAYFNSTPVPFAICYLPSGLIRKIPINELSVHWHYDATAEGHWKHDFADET